MRRGHLVVTSFNGAVIIATTYTRHLFYFINNVFVAFFFFIFSRRSEISLVASRVIFQYHHENGKDAQIKSITMEKQSKNLAEHVYAT